MDNSWRIQLLIYVYDSKISKWCFRLWALYNISYEEPKVTLVPNYCYCVATYRWATTCIPLYKGYKPDWRVHPRGHVAEQSNNGGWRTTVETLAATMGVRSRWVSTALAYSLQGLPLVNAPSVDSQQCPLPQSRTVVTASDKEITLLLFEQACLT